MMRLPSTSSRSSSPGASRLDAAGRERLAPARSTSRAAGTETSSRSGQRSAVSLPPNTQPVSMQIVSLTHAASGTGVWP